MPGKKSPKGKKKKGAADGGGPSAASLPTAGEGESPKNESAPVTPGAEGDGGAGATPRHEDEHTHADADADADATPPAQEDVLPTPAAGEGDPTAAGDVPRGGAAGEEDAAAPTPTAADTAPPEEAGEAPPAEAAGVGDGDAAGTDDAPPQPLADPPSRGSAADAASSKVTDTYPLGARVRGRLPPVTGPERSGVVVEVSRHSVCGGVDVRWDDGTLTKGVDWLLLEPYDSEADVDAVRGGASVASSVEREGGRGGDGASLPRRGHGEPAEVVGMKDEIARRLFDLEHREMVIGERERAVARLAKHYGFEDHPQCPPLPPMPGSDFSSPGEGRDYARVLEGFYQRYNPDMLPRLRRMLEDLKGREDTLPSAVADTYKRAPAAMSPAAHNYRARLERFYHKYNPNKLAVIDPMLQEAKGHEEELFKALVARYGPEPGPSPRERLVRFYEHYNPEKLPVVDEMLEEARGNEERLFAALVAMYGPEPGDYRARLERFYRRYNPDKVVVIDDMLKEARGDEEALFDALVRTYGPEPVAVFKPPKEIAKAPQESYRDRLQRFYEHYSPRDVPYVDEILTGAAGNEEGLFTALCKSYGPEPPAPAAVRYKNDMFLKAAYRKRLQRFYEYYNPQQLLTIDAMLAAAEGTEEHMFAALVKVHGPEPPPSPPLRPFKETLNPGDPQSQSRVDFWAGFPAKDETAPEAAKQQFCTRLRRFFWHYEPYRVHDTNGIAAKYAGREDELMAALVQRYGPEPPEDLTAHIPGDRGGPHGGDFTDTMHPDDVPGARRMVKSGWWGKDLHLCVLSVTPVPSALEPPRAPPAADPERASTVQSGAGKEDGQSANSSVVMTASQMLSEPSEAGSVRKGMSSWREKEDKQFKNLSFDPRSPRGTLAVRPPLPEGVELPPPPDKSMLSLAGLAPPKSPLSQISYRSPKSAVTEHIAESNASTATADQHERLLETLGGVFAAPQGDHVPPPRVRLPPEDATVPTVMGVRVVVIDHNGRRSGRQSAWPSIQRVGGTWDSAFVWNTTRGLDATLAGTAAVAVALVVPTPHGARHHASAVVPIHDLLGDGDAPPAHITINLPAKDDNNTPFHYALRLALGPPPDRKQRAFLWCVPDEGHAGPVVQPRKGFETLAWRDMAAHGRALPLPEQPPLYRFFGTSDAGSPYDAPSACLSPADGAKEALRLSHEGFVAGDTAEALQLLFLQARQRLRGQTGAEITDVLAAPTRAAAQLSRDYLVPLLRSFPKSCRFSGRVTVTRYALPTTDTSAVARGWLVPEVSRPEVLNVFAGRLPDTVMAALHPFEVHLLAQASYLQRPRAPAGPALPQTFNAANALQAAHSTNPYRERLRRFYERYNPEKVAVVDDMLEEARGWEEGLFDALVKVYGPEPDRFGDPVEAPTGTRGQPNAGAGVVGKGEWVEKRMPSGSIQHVFVPAHQRSAPPLASTPAAAVDNPPPHAERMASVGTSALPPYSHEYGAVAVPQPMPAELDGVAFETSSLDSTPPGFALAADPATRMTYDALRDTLSELLNQIAYTPGPVAAVLPAATYEQFLQRYFAETLPDADREAVLRTRPGAKGQTANHYRLIEVDLDLSLDAPIVGVREVLGSERVVARAHQVQGIRHLAHLSHVALASHAFRRWLTWVWHRNSSQLMHKVVSETQARIEHETFAQQQLEAQMAVLKEQLRVKEERKAERRRMRKLAAQQAMSVPVPGVSNVPPLNMRFQL